METGAKLCEQIRSVATGDRYNTATSVRAVLNGFKEIAYELLNSPGLSAGYNLDAYVQERDLAIAQRDEIAAQCKAHGEQHEKQAATIRDMQQEYNALRDQYDAYKTDASRYLDERNAATQREYAATVKASEAQNLANSLAGQLDEVVGGLRTIEAAAKSLRRRANSPV